MSVGAWHQPTRYFRVFNPHTQQDRWDPDGAYCARWIDELGTNKYPEPMADHKAEREESLARYQAIKGT